jgi:mannose-6-phosphate isomerase-like protein (cupin superfamily)
VAHRTVEEVWYFLAGSGRMWLRSGDRDAIIDVAPGMSVAIPAGTAFQFRSDSAEPLQAIGVTMPPWPGDGEAVAVEGPWPATI